MEFLNRKTGKNFKPVEANLKFIRARLAEENGNIQTLKAVVAIKIRDWGNDPKMKIYLRPATLFNATKFNQYVGEMPRRENES